MRPYLRGIGVLATAAVLGGTLALASEPEAAEAPTVSSGAMAAPALPLPWESGELEAAALGALAPQERTCASREPDRFYEFYFTRAIYYEGRGNDRRGGRGGRRGGSWATDYPKADCQFIVVVKRLAGLDMFDGSYAIELDDPEIRRFPFLYMLEVGDMELSESEVQGLSDYLAAGGTLILDDFWGTRQWRNFYQEIRKVFPNHPIEEIPRDDTLFGIFYNIDEIVQVPNIRNAEAISLGYSNQTSENDGYVPELLGIRDEGGRWMVIINFNTDLGDAWEHAESPYYPLRFSTFAFEMGVNMILYSMTH
jgi:hypothetical protein